MKNSIFPNAHDVLVKSCLFEMQQTMSKHEDGSLPSYKVSDNLQIINRLVSYYLETKDMWYEGEVHIDLETFEMKDEVKDFIESKKAIMISNKVLFLHKEDLVEYKLRFCS